MWIYYSIFLFLVILMGDQGSKLWVAHQIKPLGERNFVPGLLSLTNVKNNGAAWSMMSGNRYLFIMIGIIALIIAGYYLWQCRFDFGYEIAITLFISGAVGNLISRIFVGSVTDMFQTEFINFPVFNVADSSLTIGVILLMILIGFNKPLKKRD